MKQKKHKISTQLSAGFAVIVLITISVISLTANLLISHQFEKYVARPGTWIISMVWECML